MIENAGYGAGGGIVGAIAMWLGFKQRLDRVDKDIQFIREGVVWKDTCDALHEATLQRLDSIDKNLRTLLERRIEPRQ